MKCTCGIKERGSVPFIYQCPLCKAAPELLRLLDLIVMEFKSDPTSVACFDLDAIVEPAKAIVDRLQGKTS